MKKVIVVQCVIEGTNEILVERSRVFDTGARADGAYLMLAEHLDEFYDESDKEEGV